MTPPQMSSDARTLRRHRRIAKLAILCFLLGLASSVMVLLREFQSDSAAIQAKPMHLHPHPHDGSLLDRLEDVEESVYRRLDPYLHDKRGVVESLRKPIDLPHFHWGQQRGETR